MLMHSQLARYTRSTSSRSLERKRSPHGANRSYQTAPPKWRLLPQPQLAIQMRARTTDSECKYRVKPRGKEGLPHREVARNQKIHLNPSRFETSPRTGDTPLGGLSGEFVGY